MPRHSVKSIVWDGRKINLAVIGQRAREILLYSATMLVKRAYERQRHSHQDCVCAADHRPSIHAKSLQDQTGGSQMMSPEIRTNRASF